jgi:hypothetical protein
MRKSLASALVAGLMLLPFNASADPVYIQEGLYYGLGVAPPAPQQGIAQPDPLDLNGYPTQVVGSQFAPDVVGVASATGTTAPVTLTGGGCVNFVTSGTWTVTIRVEYSNDTAIPAYGVLKDTTGGGSPSYAINIGHEFCSPTSALVRLNVLTLTSGVISYDIHQLPTTSQVTSLGIVGGTVVSANGVSSDAVSVSGLFGLSTQSLSYAFNGTSWDRFRKDNYAAGPAWMTSGGVVLTVPIAAATSGPTVIKASQGRLARVLVTTQGTTTAETFYDNPSACSGTIIGVIPVTATVGTVYQIDLGANTGITACGGTLSPAVTVGYF